MVPAIPLGANVKISAFKVGPDSRLYVFADTTDVPPLKIGWTSCRNLAGMFIGETLGEMKPTGSDKKGANAAWEKGSFIGQKTLVQIVDNKCNIESITLESLPAYEAMVDAARKDKIVVALRSGFRTFGEEFLHNGFVAKKPGFATAAKPGFSNHQHGQAFDLDVGGFDGDPVYDWLKTHGPGLGFIRTVNKEPWHWEFRPTDAAALAAKGKHKAAGVTK